MQNYKKIIVLTLIFGTSSQNDSLDYNSKEQSEDTATRSIYDYEQNSDKNSGETVTNHGHLRNLETIENRLCLFYFKKNLKNSTVCSGLNVILLLGKLAVGAEGLTKQEMMKALDVSDLKALSEKLSQILLLLRAKHGAEIRIATFLYVNYIYPIKDSYSNLLMQIYGNSVINLEFNRTASAANFINTWVKNTWPRKDKRIVKDLISADEIHPWSPLVLVSTMLFKGIWPSHFPHTESRYFATASKGAVKNEMIKRRGIFNYTFSEYFDSQIIMLPLNSEGSYYILVLPSKTDGLKQLIDKLINHRELFIDSLEQMTEEYVQVILPRMGITTSQDIHRLLHMIKVQDMFRETADFTGISSKKGIYLSLARQKIRLVLTEEGAKKPEKIRTDKKLLNFVADRPFYFFAVIKETKVLSGICTEPAMVLHSVK